MRSKKFGLPRKKIAEFCKRWRITEFSLFGSVLREDFRPESDIDVLVSNILLVIGFFNVPWISAVLPCRAANYSMRP